MRTSVQQVKSKAAATAEAAAPRDAALVAEGLCKDFGTRRAVSDVSFSAERGEILGLLGPNGAGKTTTMRLLAGFIPPTRGKALIDGHNVRTHPLEARARLGYLPEHAPLYPELSIREYLGFMAELKRIPPASRRAAIERAMEECNLAESAGRVIANLSRGFKQRVGLAQAVLGDPAVLILDEPTVGLDPIQILEVRELIRAMAGRRTVLLSTHILPEVSMVCGRVVIMDRGTIAARGTPHEIIPVGGDAGAVSALTVRVVIHAENAERDRPILMDALSRTRGVQRAEIVQEAAHSEGFRIEARIHPKPGVDPRRELSRAVVEKGLPLVEINLSGGTLEDIFLQVISASTSQRT